MLPAATTGSVRPAFVTAFTFGTLSWAPLFANTAVTQAASNRSDFFDALLDAMAAVQGEFEDAFYYLVLSPATFNILRKQNVLDGQTVQDGNINVSTLLGGKIRLIVSGNELGGPNSTLVTARFKSFLLNES